MVDKEQNNRRMVVFDSPIQMRDKEIYGFLIEKDDNGQYPPKLYIKAYIPYLIGGSRFIRNGGKISDDLWIYPNGMTSLIYNKATKRLLYFLFKDEIGFKVIETDTPIQWELGEVDESDNTPCFIIKQSLIDRYISKSHEI